MATNESDYDDPEQWEYAGYQAGISGVGLGTACAMVMEEWGRIEGWAWTAFIDGWHQARADLTTYAVDMQTGADCPF